MMGMSLEQRAEYFETKRGEHLRAIAEARELSASDSLTEDHTEIIEA